VSPWLVKVTSCSCPVVPWEVVAFWPVVPGAVVGLEVVGGSVVAARVVAAVVTTAVVLAVVGTLVAVGGVATPVVAGEPVGATVSFPQATNNKVTRPRFSPRPICFLR